MAIVLRKAGTLLVSVRALDRSRNVFRGETATKAHVSGKQSIASNAGTPKLTTVAGTSNTVGLIRCYRIVQNAMISCFKNAAAKKCLDVRCFNGVEDIQNVLNLWLYKFPTNYLSGDVPQQTRLQTPLFLPLAPARYFLSSVVSYSPPRG